MYNFLKKTFIIFFLSLWLHVWIINIQDEVQRPAFVYKYSRVKLMECNELIGLRWPRTCLSHRFLIPPPSLSSPPLWFFSLMLLVLLFPWKHFCDERTCWLDDLKRTYVINKCFCSCSFFLSLFSICSIFVIGADESSLDSLSSRLVHEFYLIIFFCPSLFLSFFDFLFFFFASRKSKHGRVQVPAFDYRLPFRSFVSFRTERMHWRVLWALLIVFQLRFHCPFIAGRSAWQSWPPPNTSETGVRVFSVSPFPPTG